MRVPSTPVPRFSPRKLEAEAHTSRSLQAVFLEGLRDGLPPEGLGEPPGAGLGGGTGGKPHRSHVEWGWGTGLGEGLSLFSKRLMGHSDDRGTLVTQTGSGQDLQPGQLPGAGWAVGALGPALPRFSLNTSEAAMELGEKLPPQ